MGMHCWLLPLHRALAAITVRLPQPGFNARHTCFSSMGSMRPIPAGLLESGCTDFLRVGPLRRISRRLLGQVGQRRRQLRFVWISAGHAFRWQPLMTMTCLHLADRSPCPLHDAFRPAVPARQ